MSSQRQAATGAGFPRCARLLNGAAFKHVFAHPVKSTDRYFTVLARPRPDDGGARLGLAIARKQARRAVDRNRLKRLVREAFRQQRPALCGLDIVVMCRRDAAAGDNAALRKSLDTHWRRLRERLCASSST